MHLRVACSLLLSKISPFESALLNTFSVIKRIGSNGMFSLVCLMFSQVYLSATA